MTKPTKPKKPAGFALSNPVPQTKWEAQREKERGAHVEQDCAERVHALQEDEPEPNAERGYKRNPERIVQSHLCCCVCSH